MLDKHHWLLSFCKYYIQVVTFNRPRMCIHVKPILLQSTADTSLPLAWCIPRASWQLHAYPFLASVFCQQRSQKKAENAEVTVIILKPSDQSYHLFLQTPAVLTQNKKQITHNTKQIHSFDLQHPVLSLSLCSGHISIQATSLTFQAYS